MNILVLDWLSEETNYASHTWMDYQGGETPGDSLSISYFYLLSLIFVYTFPCAISLLANKSLALIFNFKHCKPATSNAFLSLIFFFLLLQSPASLLQRGSHSAIRLTNSAGNGGNDSALEIYCELWLQSRTRTSLASCKSVESVSSIGGTLERQQNVLAPFLLCLNSKRELVNSNIWRVKTYTCFFFLIIHSGQHVCGCAYVQGPKKGKHYSPTTTTTT